MEHVIRALMVAQPPLTPTMLPPFVVILATTFSYSPAKLRAPRTCLMPAIGVRWQRGYVRNLPESDEFVLWGRALVSCPNAHRTLVAVS
jgi:hypothetical protein